MGTEQKAAVASGAGESVMRSMVLARIASRPEFVRTSGGVGICRIPVIGEAGPASSPPRAFLYVRDGGDGLRPDEAKRCAFNLHEGDLIRAVGDIGGERPKARGQEIIVTEQVKLRARTSGTAGAA